MINVPLGGAGSIMGLPAGPSPEPIGGGGPITMISMAVPASIAHELTRSGNGFGIAMGAPAPVQAHAGAVLGTQPASAAITGGGGADPLVQMQQQLLQAQGATGAQPAAPADTGTGTDADGNAAAAPAHPHHDLLVELLEAYRDEHGTLPDVEQVARLLAATQDATEEGVREGFRDVLAAPAATTTDDGADAATDAAGEEPAPADEAAVDGGGDGAGDADEAPDPAAGDAADLLPEVDPAEVPAPGAESRSVEENARAVRSVAEDVDVDPVLAVAIMLVESGGDNRAVGDGGTSFGLFQLNERGMLADAGLTEDEAFDPLVNARVALGALADEVARNPDRTPGELAAASQRPADREGYAARVEAAMDEARRLLGAR